MPYFNQGKLPSNLKEAEDLLERYESITIEEIKKVEVAAIFRVHYGFYTLGMLTGFGDGTTCTLCRAAKTSNMLYAYGVCSTCIYTNHPKSSSCNCMKGANKRTYDLIFDSQNAEELSEAVRLRAQRLKRRIAKVKIDIKNNQD